MTHDAPGSVSRSQAEAEANAPSELLALRRLGPFEIVRPLGAGGFAPVLLARETYGGAVLREVALKVFKVPPNRGDARRRAIVGEARALCRVEHPNVVRFLQLADSEGGDVMGLAMERVVGDSLVDRMEANGGTLPEDEVLEAGVALAAALAAVHAAGLVHRDVKPANVIAAGGTYKLIDFGIAAMGNRSRPAPSSAAVAAAAAARTSSSARVLTAAPSRDAEAFERTVVVLPSGGGPPPSGATPGPVLQPDTTPMGEGAPPSRSVAMPDSTDANDNLAGTFGFVDPECMGRNAPPVASSDLYALGATLYQAISGRLPAEGDSGRLNHLVLTGVVPAPPLRERAPGASAELAALVDALIAPARAGRPPSAEVVVTELERVRRLRMGRDVPIPPEEEGPFRGLDRFEARHRAVYFGRSAEVAAALDLLRVRGLLCIVGASGSGKSSLARAAVAPALETGGLGLWPKAWDTLVVSPSEAADLRVWLASAAGLAPGAVEGEGALLGALGNRAETTGRGLVLLVDQMEELFTSARIDAADVLDLFARSAERPVPGVRIVTTVRRDFFDALLAEPRLSRVLGRSVLVVHPLPTSAWLEVLDQALARYGYAFEDEAMREAMARELRGMGDAMPLVQFALAKLWAARDRGRRVLTARALADAGGLAGALGQHAEGVVDALVGRHGPAVVEAVRAVTSTLTTAQGTRATATPAEILERARSPLAEPTLRALVDARLVTLEGGRATLSHDVLVTAWERLRRWTAAAQKERELAEEIERQAAAWTRRQAHELLWRGVQLQEARALVASRRVPLGDAALRFVGASHRFALRGTFAGAGLVVALACAAGLGYWLYTDTRARQQRDAEDVSTLLQRAATRADRSHELSLRIRELEEKLAACRKAGPAEGAPAVFGGDERRAPPGGR